VQGALPPRRPAEPVTRRRAPFVILALLVLVLTAGIAGKRVVDAGYFRVEGAAVRGTLMTTPEAVREAAGVEGRQLWDVNAGAVAEAVRALPAVQDARVERGPPNRITIVVTERTPAAVWRVGGAVLVVDEDGVVLDAPITGGMPAVNQIDAAAVQEIGGRVDGEAVRAALTVAKRLSGSGQRISRLEYSSAGGLDAVTDSGLRIRFGDSQNIEYKLGLVRSITEQARKDRITPSEIDLRYGQWAALR
jgi:cell division protein FtsQ